MKKKINLIGLLLFLSFTDLNAQSQHFYYFQGQRQYLELDTRYVFISVSDENIMNSRAFSVPNARFEPLRIDIPEGKRSRANQNKRFWTVLNLEEGVSDEVYLSMLNEIRSIESNVIVAPFFRNQYQERIGLSNFFYVRLRELSDTIILRQKAESEHAFIVFQSDVYLWFVLSITERSRLNAMEMANLFYQSGLFLYAEPDLLIDGATDCANDEYFGRQWALRNTGQAGGTSGIDIRACAAWQISTGRNVVVAVVDHGVDSSHPDLVANMHPFSYDTDSRTSPQRLRGHHGTPPAGIIGATKNNTIGIAGVAPNSRIMAISHSLTEQTVLSFEARARGINRAWRNGADVISNSWNNGTVPSQIIVSAIDSALAYGRNGKGSVVVFSSGNNHRASLNYPARLSQVIAVGAIDRSGRRANFSNFGTNLDVVAPGVEVYTTNWQGHSYTYFGGTSAAVPHVAGVAALILSIRPDLHHTEVRRVIESTARKLPNYNFNINRPNGTWSRYVGHGLVDAYAAVRAVAISGPSILCDVGTFSIDNLPADATVTWSSPHLTCAGENCTTSVENGRSSIMMTRRIDRTAYVQATVNLPNGTSMTLRRQVTAGPPRFFNITSLRGGNPSFCPGDVFQERLFYMHQEISHGNPFGITNIQWTGAPTQFQLSHPEAQNMPSGVTVLSSNFSQASLRIDGLNAHGFADIAVSVRNQCGWSASQPILYWRADNCGGGPGGPGNPGGPDPGPVCPICPGLCMCDVGIICPVCGLVNCGGGPICAQQRAIPFPNPVSDILFVNLEQSRSYSGNRGRSTSLFNIRLFNAHGMIVRQKRTQATTIQLDVSNLPEGTYYLHIEHNGDVEKHQIVVQRN